MDAKTCTKCGEEKPPFEFPRDKRAASGRSSWCKACSREAIRAWNKANKERMAELRRRWKDGNREKVREMDRRYKAANQEQIKARKAVFHAVESGRLQRPPTCDTCRSEGDIQAHHDDYSKPLEVRWLCVPCHAALHPFTATEVTNV